MLSRLDRIRAGRRHGDGVAVVVSFLIRYSCPTWTAFAAGRVSVHPAEAADTAIRHCWAVAVAVPVRAEIGAIGPSISPAAVTRDSTVGVELRHRRDRWSGMRGRRQTRPGAFVAAETTACPSRSWVPKATLFEYGPVPASNWDVDPPMYRMATADPRHVDDESNSPEVHSRA